MLVKGQLSTNRPPVVKIGNWSVKYVRQNRYLGVLISEKLSFIPHARKLRDRTTELQLKRCGGADRNIIKHNLWWYMYRLWRTQRWENRQPMQTEAVVRGRNGKGVGAVATRNVLCFVRHIIQVKATQPRFGLCKEISLWGAWNRRTHTVGIRANGDTQKRDN